MEKWRSETTEKLRRNEHREGSIPDEELVNLLEELLEPVVREVFQNGFEKGFKKGKKSRRKPRKKAPPQSKVKKRRCYKCGQYGHEQANCSEPDKSDTSPTSNHHESDSNGQGDLPNNVQKLNLESAINKIETKMKELESKLSDMEKDKEIESCKDLSQPSIPVVKWPVEKQIEWSQVQLPPQLTPYPFMNRKLQISGEMMKLRTERQESWFGPFRWKMW